ncbi:IS3 family transposase [Parafannyhessea umbonata]|uniref:IS3 family transposase n=1 Tax=Parafannyhessea umbonata TaxID=604330 RepID=UPI00359C87C0
MSRLHQHFRRDRGFQTLRAFGHLKDEFFRNRVWPSFDATKRGLDAYVIHWNTRRRQAKLKGLTPEEFRNQSLNAA